MESTTIIFILSILCILQFLDNTLLRRKINSVKSDLTKAKKSEEMILEIQVGDKVKFDYSLTHTSSNSHFEITYEAEVTEVSDDSVKVKAYSFSEKTSLPPTMKSISGYQKHIIEFISGKWIDRKDVSIIRDKDDIRDRKIEQILG